MSAAVFPDVEDCSRHLLDSWWLKPNVGIGMSKGLNCEVHWMWNSSYPMQHVDVGFVNWPAFAVSRSVTYDDRQRMMIIIVADDRQRFGIQLGKKIMTFILYSQYVTNLFGMFRKSFPVMWLKATLFYSRVFQKQMSWQIRRDNFT